MRATHEEDFVRRGLKIWCMAVVAAMAASYGFAQQDLVGLTVSTSPGQQTRGGRLGTPELRLTLKDAIAMAAKRRQQEAR